MIHIHDLPDDAALRAIKEGDFPLSITGGNRVAVIMTQSWCPDWMFMSSWLRRLAKAGEPTDRDIEVYVLAYNKVSYFHDFMTHKEKTFANHLIPYVRYYRSGEYLGDSNQLRAEQFLSRFNR